MPELNPIFLDAVGRDLNLPRVLFLTGPHGVGKSTIAKEIHLGAMGIGVYSFSTPLYEAARGAFFDGDLRDLTDERDNYVLPNVPLRRFLNDFGDWLKSQYGERTLGNIARNAALRDQTDYHFSHMIFDGARRRSDIDPIIEEFGAPNCVLLQIVRQGFDYSQTDYPIDSSLYSACDNEVFHNSGSLDDIIPSIRSVFKGRPRR